MGSPAGGVRRDQHHPGERGVLAWRGAAGAHRRGPRPGQGAGRRRRGGPRRPVAAAAREPHAVGRDAVARVGAAEPDEGRRGRHRQADERGDLRGHRRGHRPDRRAHRPQPVPRDRGAAAGRERGRVRRRGRRPAHAAVDAHADVPSLHQHRRGGLRARRRDQERDRPRGRHGVGPRLRRQREGVGDHPRPGRDRTPRRGCRRRPHDDGRPRRAWRPGRDVHVAAVAQPYVRREARQGHERRRDHRVHPAGGRGRALVRVAAHAGRGLRRRDAHRRARERPGARRDDSRADGPLPDLPRCHLRAR